MGLGRWEANQGASVVGKTYWVHIMSNPIHTGLYTGVTSDLRRRVWQHRQGRGSDFVRRYHVTQLVYFEATDRPRVAIAREKQIKAGSAASKRKLGNAQNPEWRDLYGDLA